jgi:TetR/AcrR family transcriptional regulator, mexCD-oprJ operon repressor
MSNLISFLMPATTASTPVGRPPLRERVSSAILEAAAGALVERGEQASMSDVAAAAGVARATVYRYFPSREALLEALRREALQDAGERLSAARLAELPVREGLARAVRALVTVGDRFVVLARERARPDTAEFDARIATPLRELLAGAQRHGEVRDDVPPEWLTESLFGLIVSVLASGPRLGIDDTIAAIASVFLDGARAQHSR